MFRHCMSTIFRSPKDANEIVRMLRHYDVSYAQFYHDPLGSLKMALMQRRNMWQQH
jgi:hypothetical protein